MPRSVYLIAHALAEGIGPFPGEGGLLLALQCYPFPFSASLRPS